MMATRRRRPSSLYRNNANRQRYGIISRRAVRQFMARTRKDWSGFKDISDEALLRRRDRLPVRPPIWKRLTGAQRRCLVLGAERKRFLYFNDTGTGKTLLCLALAAYFRKVGVSQRALVLVPSRINRDEWELEIFKHTPARPYLILRGSSAAKWAALEHTDAEVVVETYAGALRMLADPKRKKSGKAGNQLVLNKTRVQRFAALFGGLYMDECTYVKNRGSLFFRMCRQLAKRCPVAFGLAAMPHGRDPTDVWAQSFLIDWGLTLGENLALFRGTFCSKKETPWAIEWTFDKRKKTLLNEYLQNVSIRFEADEADMPKCVPIVRACSLPEDAEAYYERMKQALIAARGDYQAQKNAFIRMRQISSGFLGYTDDESGERARFEFPTNPKLDMTMEYVASINPKHKFILFHDFIYSGDMLAREVKKLGIKFVRVDGRTKDTKAARVRFENDPSVRAMLLVNSMAIGLNLQAARYGIFYEAPVPVIQRYQAIKRFDRQYSKFKTVFQADMITRGTVDEKLLRFHAEGRDLFEAIVRGKGRDVLAN